MTPAETALHFEALAPAWAACEAIDQPAEAEHVLRWLGASPRETGLDLACGPGRFTLHLAASGSRLLAVDLCDRMLKLAAARFVEHRVNNVTILPQDAHRLEFADGLFDWAVCRFGFRYFGEPERVFAELRRVLRPGGRLYASDWCEPAAALDALFAPLDRAHRRTLPAEEWDRLGAAAGFRVLREQRRPDRVDPRIWGALGGSDEARADEAMAAVAAEHPGLRLLTLDDRPVLSAERIERLLVREG